jgi:dihydroorotate dehydrogenase electron transfer subunit
MSQTSSYSDKRIHEVKISSNRKIGKTFYRLRLEFTEDSAAVFADFQPGQFVQLDVSNAALPPPERIPEELRDSAGRNIILRRPFSFAEIIYERNKTFAELLYCVVGPATLRMTTLTSHDSVSIIGPLGNGFQVPDNKKMALLVVGGMGVPPLQHLAQNLTNEYPQIDAIAFAGAKTREHLPFEGQLDEVSRELGFLLHEFAKYGIESIIATDDGSVGFKGLVTDCLIDWLDKTELNPKDIIIYACGPELMLARLAQISRERNIDCQVSMERRMACGIGLCQSCAVECRVGTSNETVYKLCCKDGPVFNAKELVF